MRNLQNFKDWALIETNGDPTKTKIDITAKQDVTATKYTDPGAPQRALNLDNEDKLHPNFKNKDYWTLITVMACENFTENSQGMADTAQSIYNRVNTPGQPYGKTVRDVILSKNQYEPVTIGKKKGAKWDTINSRAQAEEVYKITKGFTADQAKKAIETAVQAQMNTTLGDAAGKWVGSRTEFLASKPTSTKAVGAKERSTKDNAFFWNYAGKSEYYDKGKKTATAKPDTVQRA
jgi:hypothetical protein